MAKTVTATFSISYDTTQEYEEDLANLTAYEADESNRAITNKTTDPNGRTITFTLTETH